MKNILMHVSITGLINKAVEEFVRSHKDDHFVLIYEMLEDCEFHPDIEGKERMLLTKNMRAHDFRTFEGFFESEPVDRTILEKMSRYEGAIYKMMDTYFPPLGSFDERQRIYFDALRFFHGLLKKYKIELYIAFGVPHQIYDYVLYCLCKCLGIKTYLIYRQPIRGYIYYFNDLDEHGVNFGKKSITSLPEDFEKSYNAYTQSKDGVKLYYMPGKSLKARMKVLSDKIKMFFRYDNAIGNLGIAYKLKKRKKQIDRLIRKLECKSPDLECKFLFVGLHYQPEGTTSPMAGVYVNQQLIIEMLSYCVPDDVLIYVKEHPNQNLRGEKNLTFFSQISKLRNVKIVPTGFSSNLLTRKCLAVVTCTGTVAYEAAYLGKPTLLFGSYLYNYLPCCLTVNSVEDCKKAIADIISKRYCFDEKAMRSFLQQLSGIAYHAEFALSAKDFMTANGVSLDHNNHTVKTMLDDIYQDYCSKDEGGKNG